MSSTTVATPGPVSDAERESRRLVRRSERYKAREVLWREAGWLVAPTDTEHGRRRRVAYCGKHATGDSVTVKVTGGSSAGFGGVQSCGSVWACPVCSEKINAERQADLSAGLDRWVDGRTEAGAARGVLFGTLTLSHKRSQRLADLWDAISPAWNRTTSGAGVAWHGSKRATGYEGDRRRFGIVGHVRVVEVKHGANGWHPHIHFLMFTDRVLNPAEVLELEERLFGRWVNALSRSGLTASRSRGIDLRPVTSSGMADYFAKGTYTGVTSSGAAAFEVTGSHAKRQGKGGRTPFEILADLVAFGDEADLDLWREWEEASHGRRQLTWSRGLRDLLALDDERTDEEIAEDDNGGEVVAVIASGDYTRLARAGMLVDVLEAAERRDRGRSLRALLDEWGCLRISDLTHDRG